MLYETRAIKVVLESDITPTLTKNLLSTALMANALEAECALEAVLDLIRDRNEQVFPHLRSKKS